MTTAIGTLKLNANGRWTIEREGRLPYELSSGSLFLVEVDGVLRLTRIEYAHDRHGGGLYYSVDGCRLADGLRAAPPNEAKDGQVL
jgi:hypothetical protein